MKARRATTGIDIVTPAEALRRIEGAGRLRTWAIVTAKAKGTEDP